MHSKRLVQIAFPPMQAARFFLLAPSPRTSNSSGGSDLDLAASLQD